MALDLSTPSHKRGSTYIASKKEIFICNNQSDLYEGNTPTATKRMSFS